MSDKKRKGQFRTNQTLGKKNKQYKIKDRQLSNAKKHKVRIEVANDRSKKIDVFELDKKVKSGKRMITKKGKRLATIGGLYEDGTPMGDYASYLLDPRMPKTKEPIDPNEQRKNYLARHAHEPKDKIDEETGRKVKTPSYWADVILWA